MYKEGENSVFYNQFPLQYDNGDLIFWQYLLTAWKTLNWDLVSYF